MPNLHCEAIAFPSSDGKHTSSAFLYTVPGQPVRAVLQLSHGMCEYVRRYEPMAEFYRCPRHCAGGQRPSRPR